MFNPAHLVETGGLLLITIIIFAESGMLIGFFLPGDTLLLSAGVFAAQGKLPLAALLILVILAAIVGDNVGYTIGKTMGKRIFRKKDGLLFRQEYVAKAEQFYEKHGPKTMLLAHFLPIVRTFAPLVAGVGNMPRKQFAIFDAIGDTAWGAIVILLGYWFGSRIPNIDHYILPTVGLAVLISFGPMAYHLGKALLKNKNANEHTEQPSKD